MPGSGAWNLSSGSTVLWETISFAATLHKKLIAFYHHCSEKWQRSEYSGFLGGRCQSRSLLLLLLYERWYCKFFSDNLDGILKSMIETALKRNFETCSLFWLSHTRRLHSTFRALIGIFRCLRRETFSKWCD